MQQHVAASGFAVYSSGRNKFAPHPRATRKTYPSGWYRTTPTGVVICLPCGHAE